MNTIEVLRDFFVAWGASWVLWLLLALSVASLAVAVERFIFFNKKRDDLRGLIGALDEHLKAGNAEAALAALSGRRSVGAKVAAAGLRLADRGPRAAEKSMESAMALERKVLEARLSFLGTLGNNAPFVGLFGTIIGVMLAFHALGDGGATATAPGASQAASAAVMSSISEALVATAVGLAVALPAVALYNYFQRRIANMMADAEALSALVVAYLEDESLPRAPARLVELSSKKRSEGAA